MQCVKLPNGMSAIGPRKHTAVAAYQQGHETRSEYMYSLLLAATGPILQRDAKYMNMIVMTIVCGMLK